MRGKLRNWIRVAAAAIALGIAAPVAHADGWETPADSVRERRHTLWGLPRDDPAIGVAALFGGIALLVFLTWVAARFGDEK